jgi:hypothetical protein
MMTSSVSNVVVNPIIVTAYLVDGPRSVSKKDEMAVSTLSVTSATSLISPSADTLLPAETVWLRKVKQRKRTHRTVSVPADRVLKAVIAPFTTYDESRRTNNRPLNFYSMILSALTSRVDEILRPSALAVFWLIHNSSVVGNSTGKSAGLAPFSILST